MSSKEGTLVRPAALIICFLAATGFLASYLKFDVNTVWYKPRQSDNPGPKDAVLPNARLWARLSREPRLPYNRCNYSYCPLYSNWNKSPFVHPFNAGNTCPFYFSYIHEDLAPWSSIEPDIHHQNKDLHDLRGAEDHTQSDDLTMYNVSNKHKTVNYQENGSVINGISQEMLDNGTVLANFRIVIKSGRLYVEPYRECFQTRAIFTIWGLLQLLRFYPALVPDVDMLFGCEDTPRVSKRRYNKDPPPPVFGYCSSAGNLDIPFPDWSFWGWHEIDLRPWDDELSDILKGENILLWEQRRPTAFWKGNTRTGGKMRYDLKSCTADYGAEIIHQDWRAAAKARYENSRLAQQCKNRYKVYAEGRGWSVSLKYILACDSPVLLVHPMFHDFFSRGLMPMKHYWPISRDKLCTSIKFAVDWGNNNTHEAERMGRMGRQFIAKEVRMKHVYDYMLHVLHQYAKLLQFEPKPGEHMREVCTEEMVCLAPDRERALYEESMVRQASEQPPCFLGPREKKLIQDRLQERTSITKLVQQAEHIGKFIHKTF